MKNSTIIALALLLLSTNASAQRYFRHYALHGGFVSLDPKIMKDVVSKPAKKTAPLRKALSLPTTEQTYLYEDGEWIEDASYTYTYDAKGNILTQVEEYDGEQTKTVYEYNENGKVTRKTTMSGDGMGGFDNSSLLTQDYDEKVPSLIVKSLEYTWNDDDWTMISAGRTWQRDVARNSAGNVTGVGLNTYYDGAFELSRQTSLEYGTDGQPTSWKYDELTYSGSGAYEMKEVYTLSDMAWHACDGQVVTMDLDGFYTGNNLLSHAVVTEPDYGQTGTIDATYTDYGGYELTYNYTEPLSRDVTTLECRENGSYTMYQEYYEDLNEDGELTEDELEQSSVTMVLYDEHGNIMLEETYLDDIMDYSVAYDYTYNDYSDYPMQQIYYEYNPETEDYEPFMKIVSDDYMDVTTGLNLQNNAAESAETAVYGLQGVKLGNSTNGLPKGVYIVKNGDKVVKQIKK